MDIEFRPDKITGLSIWDIGAQLHFEFLRLTFYKAKYGAIILSDLTREATYIEIRKSFTEIKQAFLNNCCDNDILVN